MYKRLMELVIYPHGAAHWRDHEFRCALGRSGVSENKTEGDGATPCGIIKPRKILYRADRLAAPEAVLPVEAIQPDDGWCDAPEDADYNRQVEFPHDASCEALWRDDHIYDLVAVTSYNETPIIPGKGSAIFIHLAREGYSGTEGCIAFSEADLRLMLADIRPGDMIRVCAS
jgi:L,D-peptidoglycan transpeptidase YkuD (ErfK/YbiS/YcfS/YnhG family)